jgi:hypothetical protein
MLKRILAATVAATILTAFAGQAAAADGDPTYVFRWHSTGLIVLAGSPEEPPPGGGEEEPDDGKSPMVDIGFDNGWHVYCPARPGATDATIAGLIGQTFRFNVGEDLIYTSPDGSGPFGISISYWDRRLPDSTYGFDALLDPDSFGCADEWGHIGMLNNWTKVDRDSAVSAGGFESAIVSGGVSMRAAFPYRPPE